MHVVLPSFIVSARAAAAVAWADPDSGHMLPPNQWLAEVVGFVSLAD